MMLMMLGTPTATILTITTTATIFSITTTATLLTITTSGTAIYVQGQVSALGARRCSVSAQSRRAHRYKYSLFPEPPLRNPDIALPALSLCLGSQTIFYVGLVSAVTCRGCVCLYVSTTIHIVHNFGLFYRCVPYCFDVSVFVCIRMLQLQRCVIEKELEERSAPQCLVSLPCQVSYKLLFTP